MGNYKNIDYDFMDRTVKLINQYEIIIRKERYPFQEQYNYTLLLNCLLGVIVMTKENIFEEIPDDELTEDLKAEMGLIESQINPNDNTLKSLVHQLRNSIAHFDLDVLSENENSLIDWIVFKRTNGETVVKFKSTELLDFVRYYADWMKSILEEVNNL
mgnify:CR=1 FL=1